MDRRRLDFVIGAACIMPLVPTAWIVRGVFDAPRDAIVVGDRAASSCGCQESIGQVLEAVRSLALVHDSGREKEAGGVPSRRETVGSIEDAGLRRELDRYFSTLWRTGLDDEFGIRKAVLESGRSPFEPGVEESMADAWAKIVVLHDQFEADCQSIKGRFPMVIQYGGVAPKDVPEGLRAQLTEVTNAYSRARYERRQIYERDAKELGTSLRTALSK